MRGMRRNALSIAIVAFFALALSGCFAGGGPSSEEISERLVSSFTDVACADEDVAGGSVEQSGGVHWCGDVSENSAEISSSCRPSGDGETCIVNARDEGVYRVTIETDENDCRKPTDLEVVKEPAKESALATLLDRRDTDSGRSLAELWAQGAGCG